MYANRQRERTQASWALSKWLRYWTVTRENRTMASKSTGDPAIDALYKFGKGRVEFVDVPELGFVMIDGVGAPEGESFAGAL